MKINLTPKQLELVTEAIQEYSEICHRDSLTTCTTNYDEDGRPKLKTFNKSLSKLSKDLDNILSSILRQMRNNGRV